MEEIETDMGEREISTPQTCSPFEAPAGPPVSQAHWLARIGFDDALSALRVPGPLSAFACGVLMLLACNVNGTLGHRALIFKHYYAHAFVLAVVVATACRLYRGWPDARAEMIGMTARSVVLFGLFCALVGVGVLVSNGTTYQAMASNYWDTNPFDSTSRRIALPVLANVLGFDKTSYIAFWYATLFSAFALAVRYLHRAGLEKFETLSVLTSSIFAYSLIGPGYNEIYVFLLGLYALQFRLGVTEKIVVATMMIATHETATPFVALAVILSGDAEARGQWLVIFGSLYLAYVAAYALTWRLDIVTALMTTGKPSAGAGDSSIELMLRCPMAALLGILMAYKLYWAIVLTALGNLRTRHVALAIMLSLGLTAIGTDTSRLVQFSSLTFLSLMAAMLPTLPLRWRLSLAAVNLVVPSVYVATNAGVLWGMGLYSLYLTGASMAGLGWGRLFVQ